MFNLAMKGLGGPHPSTLLLIESRNGVRLAQPDERSGPGIQTWIDRQQLINRREGSCQLGEIEDSGLPHAIHEGIEGVQRPAVGGAERHERTRVAPASKHFEK